MSEYQNSSYLCELDHLPCCQDGNNACYNPFLANISVHRHAVIFRCHITSCCSHSECWCVWVLQGVEGASAAAHALSLPAEAYGNDVSGHLLRLHSQTFLQNARKKQSNRRRFVHFNLRRQDCIEQGC